MLIMASPKKTNIVREVLEKEKPDELILPAVGETTFRPVDIFKHPVYKNINRMIVNRQQNIALLKYIDDCNEGKPCMTDEEIALVEKIKKCFGCKGWPRISEEKN